MVWGRGVGVGEAFGRLRLRFQVVRSVKRRKHLCKGCFDRMVGLHGPR